jgi:hypothetical protein
MQQTKVTDNAVIYQAVNDYYEGWYTPDTQRIAGCLHPGLAKRAIRQDGAGSEYLLHETNEMMLDATRQGGGSLAPAGNKNWAITILDTYQEIATVKVNCPEFVDYLHLARQNGQWRIVNILGTHNREHV